MLGRARLPRRRPAPPRPPRRRLLSHSPRGLNATVPLHQRSRHPHPAGRQRLRPRRLPQARAQRLPAPSRTATPLHARSRPAPPLRPPRPLTQCRSIRFPSPRPSAPATPREPSAGAEPSKWPLPLRRRAKRGREGRPGTEICPVLPFPRCRRGRRCPATPAPRGQLFVRVPGRPWVRAAPQARRVPGAGASPPGGRADLGGGVQGRDPGRPLSRDALLGGT